MADGPFVEITETVAQQVETDRLRVLENVVFAQRWDIEGLTGQRDDAYQRLEAADAELLALRSEVERLQDQVGELEQEARRVAHSLAGRSNASARTRRRTMHVAAALALGTEPHGDPLMDMSREWTGEAVLIQASGLFDYEFYLEFYLRQIDTDYELPQAICHYLMEGEAAGLLPNPLFQATYYADEARRAGFANSLGRFRTLLGHYAAIGAANGLRPGPLVDYAWCFSQVPPRDRESFEPIRWWLQIGRDQGAMPHPLVDAEFYRRLRGTLRANDDVLADYMLVGAGLRLSLSPLFDPVWYLDEYQDVREAGIDPLLHYLGFGEAEGRQPNPLFDPLYYIAQLPAPLPKGMSALSHYVTHGKRAGAATHLMFDGAWYLAQNEDVRATGVDPLLHYLVAGAAERRSPHPLVDVKFLLGRHPALPRYNPNPLIAFLRSNERVDASAHPLFDVPHYVAQVPEAAGWQGGVFEHFLRFGADNRADPHPLFCTEYYLRQLPSPPLGRSALVHYLTQGRAQGLRPHPLFDPWFYLRTNVDVARSQVDPLVHFVESGGTRREHRQPHPLFDLPLYASRIGDAVPDSVNLLLDYMLHWRDRPSPHLLFDAAFYEQQSGDPALHGNPLADYAWKGAQAPRSPHPLFETAWYRQHVEVPEDWQRTLLEHYCTRQAPENFVPHPAVDGNLLAAQMTDDLTGNSTLLEYYVAEWRNAQLDPHLLFPAHAYSARHPDGDPGVDGLTRYLLAGGTTTWTTLPAAQIEVELCGTGAVAAVNPHTARGRGQRHRAPERAANPESWLLSGKLKAGAPKVALYAAHASANAVALHAHALSALHDAGYAIVFIDGALSEPRRLPRRLQRLVDVSLSHVLGGQQIGSWVLACRLLGEQLAACEHVLFLTDNMVGPFGPMEPVWQSLAAAMTAQPTRHAIGHAGWWALTAADQFTDVVEAEMFALSGAIVASAAFTGFVQTYRFADTPERTVEPAEQDMSRALLNGGWHPRIMAPSSALRAAWLRSMPARQRWFRDLRTGRLAVAPRGLSAAEMIRLADLGDNWLRKLALDPTSGARLRPSLLFWDALLQQGVPFLRRDVLVANMLKSPDLLRVPELLGGAAMRLLATLIGPILPEYPPDLTPLLRLTASRLPQGAAAALPEPEAV